MEIPMNKTTAMRTTALAALSCAGSLQAHHSISMIDVSTSIWVKGTVVRYEAIHPHVMIELEERGEDGQTETWTIEGPIPGRLDRILRLNGMDRDDPFLRVGDAIEVCGFIPKRRASRQDSSPSTGRLPQPFIHGHVVVMPDGRMQTWGPYGKLDNCVRPNDQTQPWVDFLKSDQLAREFWCNSRSFVSVASTAPDGFVDEINGLIANLPCG
jgi:hypothetical protein